MIPDNINKTVKMYQGHVFSEGMCRVQKHPDFLHAEWSTKNESEPASHPVPFKAPWELSSSV